MTVRRVLPGLPFPLTRLVFLIRPKQVTWIIPNKFAYSVLVGSSVARTRGYCKHFDVAGRNAMIYELLL
jgi:hypothetical protein